MKQPAYTAEQHAERAKLERVFVDTALSWKRSECVWDDVIRTLNALAAFEDRCGRPTP